MIFAMIVVLESLMVLSGCESEGEYESSDPQVYPSGEAQEKAYYAVERLEPEDYPEETKDTLAIAAQYVKLIDAQKEQKGRIDEKEIMKQLGSKGYIVKEEDNRFNTENSSKLEAFCKKLQRNETADVTVYEIGALPGLNRIDLKMSDEKLTVTMTVVSLDEAGRPFIEGMNTFKASDWYYTDKGYLMYQNYQWSGYDGPKGDYCIRVKDQDESYRPLCDQYISPIHYGETNMFLVDWDEKSLGRLGLLDLYESLYRLKNGIEMDTEKYSTGISKEVFEEMVTSYFNMPKEALEKKTYYDAAQEKYLWHDRQMEEFNSQCEPTPEVTGYRDNPDGTFTLTVDAFWPSRRTDCAFQHEVTIRPEQGGGFKYVSNHIIPSKENILPYYMPRLNEDIKENE